MEQETIVAISTAPGLGGIGIIRLSGSKTFDIILKIFKSKKIKSKEDIKANTINYGHIVDENGNIVDEVMVSFFKAPHSYTKEDVAEINTHGGSVVIQTILQIAINAGAKVAIPGEFTKRAFLNGRIDLTKVESIASILNAKSQKELEISNKLLKGRLSDNIQKIKKKLLDLLMYLEVNIDYPEYEVEEKSKQDVENALKEAQTIVDGYLKNADIGLQITEGIKVGIIGKPNVGKSSLLNMILNEQRAIVTDIAGTTRDTIEEVVSVDGMPLKIIDTAGIRKTDEVVEKIGIEKSIEIAKTAQIVILLLDWSKPLSQEDLEILEILKGKEVITIFNKTDLEQKIDVEKVKEYLNEDNFVYASMIENKGLDEILDKIRQYLSKLQISNDDEILIIHQRQKEVLELASDRIKEALIELQILPIDMISEYIKLVIEALNSLTGEDTSQEVLDKIFANFCLGK